MSEKVRAIQEAEDVISKHLDVVPIKVVSVKWSGQISHPSPATEWHTMITVGRAFAKGKTPPDEVGKLRREVNVLRAELAQTRDTVNVDKQLIEDLSAKLRNEVEQNNKRIDELKERIPEQKIVVLRDISEEEARKEIRKLFSTKRTLFYSDVAYELGLSLKMVVDICNELQKSGEIGVDDGAA